MSGPGFNNNQVDQADGNAGSDKRYLPRWEVNNRIQYQLEHDLKVYEARTKDLSCAGACLVISEAIPLKQKVKMKIFLSENTTVEAEGKIVWCRPTTRGNIVGIDFCETPEEVKGIIQQSSCSLQGIKA